jgi:hypothetical protein
MYGSKLLRRFKLVAAVGVLVTGLVACDDDPVQVEPEIDQVRLVIGSVTINSVGGNLPSQTPSIPRGTLNVTITALDADGDPITLEEDVELQITSVSGVPISFTRSTTNPLAGSLTVNTAGTANILVQLFSVEHDHDEYTIGAEPPQGTGMPITIT